MRLSGARVLLTGASGGIGAAVATTLVQRGARLVVSGRDETALATAQLPAGTRTITADLTNEAAVRQLAKQAGDLDVLINNAGVGWYGSTAEMPCDDIRRLVEVNTLAPLLLTRLVLPGMAERRRGHVVFVGSVAGHLGVENEAVYSATKAAVRTYAEALQAEVRGQGIAVSTISPGAVATDFFAHRGTSYQRSWPAAVPPETVATAIANAIERGDRQVFVPQWMRLPALLHDRLPGLYRGLANKLG
jgi:short-subunit dehydrogenase